MRYTLSRFYQVDWIKIMFYDGLALLKVNM